MKTALTRVIAACSLAAAFLTPAVAADPIVFGLVDEVTGPQAEAGLLTAQGVKLAIEEINAAGGIIGRQVELRIEDNASTNPTTVLAYTKLTEAAAALQLSAWIGRSRFGGPVAALCCRSTHRRVAALRSRLARPFSAGSGPGRTGSARQFARSRSSR
jgi:hypothetical protein